MHSEPKEIWREQGLPAVLGSVTAEIIHITTMSEAMSASELRMRLLITRRC